MATTLIAIMVALGTTVAIPCMLINETTTIMEEEEEDDD